MIKKAQSILEYVIVLSAIVTAVIAAAKPGGPIRQAIDNMFSDASNVISERCSAFRQQAALQ
jgi:phage-related minor tail protein